MSHVLRCIVVAFIYSSFISTSVRAETEELFVTAQRFPVDINKTLSNITLIERAQIAASGAADLPSLLALTPSIAISRAGGPGQQTSVFLRGTESDHFLLIVDGVRIASATSGAAALNLVSSALKSFADLVPACMVPKRLVVLFMFSPQRQINLVLVAILRPARTILSMPEGVIISRPTRPKPGSPLAELLVMVSMH